MSKKCKLEFGDIVRNEWASCDNPERVLMVVHVGRTVNCLSRKGKKVQFCNDKDLRLTKIGKENFGTWDYAIESQICDNCELLANDSRKAEASGVRVDALVSDNRRWKRVEEALPEEREHVLCFVEYPNNDRGVFFRVGWLKYAAGDKDCPYFVIPHRRSPETNEYPEFKVTHWQELPDKPHE